MKSTYYHKEDLRTFGKMMDYLAGALPEEEASRIEQLMAEDEAFAKGNGGTI